MDYRHLLYHRDEHIVTISLNRCEVLNALSPELICELRTAIERFQNDEQAHLLILKGEGRAFSAGVDLKAMQDHIRDGKFSMQEILDEGVDLIDRIYDMPKICIAQVHGHCYTGALELMLAFDLVYCADETKLGDTHAKWGILPKWGMSQRLIRRVGVMQAREMSYTCRPITGPEAARIGLVNASVPLAELENFLQRRAHDILKNSRQTVAAFKHLYHRSEELHLDKALQVERDYNPDITDREDMIKAFQEQK